QAYKDFVKPKAFEIYQESPNYLFVPRFYGINRFGEPIKNKLTDGTPMASNLKMVYDLLPHQHVGYDKAYNALKNNGGGILSVVCGWGKTACSLFLAIAFF